MAYVLPIREDIATYTHVILFIQNLLVRITCCYVTIADQQELCFTQSVI